MNDPLITGPAIQRNILHLLMQRRQHHHVVAADIKGMYRQFWLNEADRVYQRILWRFNTSEPIQHYQLNTITYDALRAAAVRT